jgi:hypothetical protein
MMMRREQCYSCRVIIVKCDSEVHQGDRNQLKAYLYQFSWRRTPSPAVNCVPKNTRACFRLMSPRARGRSLVLSYCHIRFVRLRKDIKNEHTNSLVQIFIPHIIDCAPCSSHDERSKTKQAKIREWHAYGGLCSIRSHCN